ncbi:MAG: peptide chain release factor subunit 1 [Thermoleophilaceae bacterium]|jgi:peptide subunit release factor 1 (eRF1)|nr:peptide chain release factor subunit 1 [Thermoleophilaceae bacterium]
MQTNDLSNDLLRRLADFHPTAPSGAQPPLVLSLFLNLDPSQFGTQPARATEINSLLDQADRTTREAGDLTHDQHKALHADLERARRFFEGADFEGAHGLALYVCGPADLFEAIKLPRPVDTRACVNDSPFVEPLAELAMRGTWAVLLVNRQSARMFRGSPDGLQELPPIVDEVHRRHDQGGLSQARYQRSVDKEVQDHLKHVAEVVLRRFRHSPFQRVLLGGPEEILSDVEQRLHPYVREKIVGHVKVDVENTNAEGVRTAAAPAMEEIDRKREREAFERLEEAIGAGGRGTAGLDETIGALNERRVETLLVVEHLGAPGVHCPTCGWVGVEELSICPIDGGELRREDDVVESAIELAILQSAEVLVARHEPEELERRGGMAALLRF